MAQLAETEEKVTDLQRLADQSRALKDEVDILRETSDKVRALYYWDKGRILSRYRLSAAAEPV